MLGRCDGAWGGLLIWVMERQGPAMPLTGAGRVGCFSFFFFFFFILV